MKMGKDISSAINRVDDWKINRTMSFLCRMASNGVKLKGEQQDYLNENFDSLIALGKAKKKKRKS